MADRMQDRIGHWVVSLMISAMLVLGGAATGRAQTTDVPNPKPGDEAAIQECIRNGGDALTCAVIVQTDAPGVPGEFKNEAGQAATDCMFFQTVVVGLDPTTARQVCGEVLGTDAPTEPTTSQQIEQPGDTAALAACQQSGFSSVECLAIVQGGTLNIGSDPARFRELTDCLFHQTVVLGLTRDAAGAICDSPASQATAVPPTPTTVPTSQPTDNRARCAELQAQGGPAFARIDAASEGRFDRLDLDDPELKAIAAEMARLGCPGARGR